MTKKRKRNSTSDNRPTDRLTIGFFNVDIGPDWAKWQWQGIVDAARHHDVNLLSFIGRALRWGPDFQEQTNVLYDLAKGERLDGLIIWITGLAMALTEAEAEAFCNQYGIPMITDRVVGDWPRMVYGDYRGMRAAVDHLIEVHGYQRIGFVGMHEHHSGMQERYRAYTDALAVHGLPFDSKIAKPWFPDEFLLPPDGHVVEEVLSSWVQEALTAGVEALVGVCDTTTLQVLKMLQAQGVNVPGQVALVSFDDFTESRVITPPLTTVMPSWYEVGYQTLETLVGILKGQPAPKQVRVTPRLMVRRSCGCADPAVIQAAVGPVKRTAPAASFNRQETALAMVQTTQAYGMVELPHKVEHLLDSFETELGEGHRGTFLSELEQILRQVVTAGDEIVGWQEAISILRQQVLLWLDEDEATARAEDMLQQARVMVSQVAERAQAYRRLQAKQQADHLREVSQALITTFDVDRLMDVLAERLPGLGIPGCYVSLYENPQTYKYPDPAPEWSRLVLAYNEQGRVKLEPGGRRFQSRLLIPEELWPQDRIYCFVAEPLYFQNNQLGFVLFEVGPREGSIYNALRGQISSALQGALLLRERERAEAALEKAYAEVELEVQQRTAELQREITERKRVEETLAHERDLFHTLMDNVPDSIYFKDTAGRFTRVNRAEAEVFGVTPGEAIGKTDFDFFGEVHAREALADEQTVMSSGLPIVNKEEKEVWADDSRERWVSTTKLPLRDKTGQIVGTFGISREITEQKRAEAELQRYQEHLEELVSERTRALEEAQAELVRRERLSALGQLTATVAHEIRNPLGTVRNSVYSIRAAIERGQLSRLEPALQRAERNITRCDNIIAELLDYTRTHELKLQPLCWDEWLQHILDELTIPEDITLSVDLVKNVEVSLDPGRFRQVVVNLIDNACQAMQETTQPDGSQHILHVQAEIIDKQLKISITDTGPGIPPEVMPHIFEPLYSTKSFGVGLGLPVVDSIIKQHDGKIEINSEIGTGTQVMIWLPLA